MTANRERFAETFLPELPADEVGLLEEEYFLYWEESEWFWRLRERGAVVEYRPEIILLRASAGLREKEEY